MNITKALSIQQPFAEQIMAGTKTTEYRTMPTNKAGERVYIYASLKLHRDLASYDYMENVKRLPRGVIVGSVVIVGQMQDKATGLYHWFLAEPKRLRKPLKPKNKPQPVFFKPF